MLNIFLMIATMVIFLTGCNLSQGSMDATETAIAGDIFETLTASAPAPTASPAQTTVPNTLATATTIPTPIPTQSILPTPDGSSNTVSPYTLIAGTWRLNAIMNEPLGAPCHESHLTYTIHGFVLMDNGDLIGVSEYTIEPMGNNTYHVTDRYLFNNGRPNCQGTEAEAFEGEEIYDYTFIFDDSGLSLQIFAPFDDEIPFITLERVVEN